MTDQGVPGARAGVGAQPPDALWSQVIDDLAAADADLDVTLGRLTDRAAVAMGTTCAVFVMAPSGSLRAAAFAGGDPERLAQLRQMFDGVALTAAAERLWEVAQHDEPRLIEVSPTQPTPGSPYRRFIDDSGILAYYLVPLVSLGTTVGVLAAAQFSGRPPLAELELATARRFATVATQLVRLAVLVDRRRMAEVAMSAMREAVIAVDPAGLITFWSPGAEHLYGYPGDEVLGLPARRILISDDGESPAHQIDLEAVREALLLRGGWMGRVDQRRRDGRTVTVDSLVSPLPKVGHSTSGAVIVNRDVSAEVAIGNRLRRQQALAQAALDASPMLTAVMDQDGCVVAANRAWVEHLGPHAGIGGTWRGVVEGLTVREDVRDQLLTAVSRVLREEAPRAHRDVETHVQGLDRTFSVHVARVPDVGATVTIADVTARASRERALSYTATHDHVTRLPNRSVLMDRAAHALTRAGRQRVQLGVLFVDLDGFKGLNDRFGHGTGDDVLELVARRLTESCRASDTVARLGGDEFAILIEDSVNEDTVAHVAERVIAAAARPMKVAAGELSLTSSVGAVVVKPDPDRQFGESDVEHVLAQADAAMYEAKRRGKNRWVMFDDAIQTQHEDRGALVGDLVRGTRNGDFRLHYQPQFDVAGHLGGAEAQLRWQHPQRGLIEPFEIIAEAGTLPLAIGDWMLGQVAEQAARWQDHWPEGARLAVNLTRWQWLDRSTAEVLLDWLSRKRVRPRAIRLEVSQDALSADLDHSAVTMRRLTQAGIDVAVNQFGAGALPFVDMARLPVGTVVLSRQVMRDPGATGEPRDVLRGLVALSRQLGWQVIATGVESHDQLQAARQVHCHLIQGFLLGRPVSADEFAHRWLGGPPGPTG